MVDILRPSSDPANQFNLSGVLKEVLNKFLSSTDDMLPAEIVSYDRATNKAVVRPLVMILKTDDSTVKRAEIEDISVLILGGGGSLISFNLPAGSKGWIKASDRDISLYKQSLSEERPNTKRMHNFIDSIFIPDVIRGYTIDDDDSEAMVIQNISGTKRISLNDTRIKITSDTPIEFDGNLSVTGTIGATGNITSDSDVLAGSISLNSHSHDGSPTAPNGPISDVGAPK